MSPWDFARQAALLLIRSAFRSTSFVLEDAALIWAAGSLFAA
jgi:hypothetical protein